MREKRKAQIIYMCNRKNYNKKLQKQKNATREILQQHEQHYYNKILQQKQM